jgi:hypothetical protein
MDGMKDLKKLSDEDLEKYLKVAVRGTAGRTAAMKELTRRRLGFLSMSQWTVTRGFWIALTAMIIAALAAWPVLQKVFQPSPFADQVAGSRARPSPSKSSSPLEPEASVSWDRPAAPSESKID